MDSNVNNNAPLSHGSMTTATNPTAPQSSNSNQISNPVPASSANPAISAASSSISSSILVTPIITDPKILKKAKALFDDKQKLKVRIATLQSLLDSLYGPEEEGRVFREYDSTIHALVAEYVHVRMDKVRKLREGKVNVSVHQVLQSKELSELFKATSLFRKWMAAVFVPDHLKSNAASGKIASWKTSISQLNYKYYT